MIYKIPEQPDEFKEQIEKITKEIKKQGKKYSTNVETRQRMNEIAPKLKIEIQTRIDELKKLFLRCEPIDLMSYLSYTYSISSPDKFLKDIDSMSNAYLDYCFSFITSLDYSNSEISYDESDLTKIKEQVEALYNQIMVYVMAVSNDEHGRPHETRFLQTVNHLIVRGDSYTQHKVEFCRELYAKYDDIRNKDFGISSNVLIDELLKIGQTPIKNFEIYLTYMNIMKIAHENFQKFCDECEEKNIPSSEVEELYKNSKLLEETNQQLQSIYDQTHFSFNDSVFKINKLNLPQSIVDLLTLKFGENSIFREGDIEYFPMNDSLIYDKPIVYHNREYYCFDIPLIYYNLHMIIENIVLSCIPENKKSKQYYAKKADYLEDKSLEYFQNILPNCKVFQNLKYNDDDEVDGIVLYDNYVFIIEAKSNKFTLEAKKGSIDRIKRNTKDIVDKAYQQAIRAKKYILSNDEVSFRDKTKKTVLTISDTSNKKIFMINTTLEPLGELTANLNSLKQFGFIQGQDWIWSVYLNDLRIISEIIESPIEFLVYLERRINLNDFPQLHTVEEINIFGHFLQNGLYFDDIKFPEHSFKMSLVGFSEQIDKYYMSLEKNIDEICEKPSYINKCPAKEIVKKIESLQKEHFSGLTKYILESDEINQNMIVKQIDQIQKKQRQNLSIFRKQNNTGLTFVHKDIFDENDMKSYCKIFAYQQKINNWYLISIDEISTIDFEFLQFFNEYDEMLEKEVMELKERRLEQAKDIQKKIGRNDMCPCGSGKKYKKCCKLL